MLTPACASATRSRLPGRPCPQPWGMLTTPGMMSWVVSIPHGWGHGRPGSRLRVADAHAGVSINALTDHAAVDALVGTAVLNGTPVEVAAAA